MMMCKAVYLTIYTAFKYVFQIFHITYQSEIKVRGLIYNFRLYLVQECFELKFSINYVGEMEINYFNDF